MAPRRTIPSNRAGLALSAQTHVWRKKQHPCKLSHRPLLDDPAIIRMDPIEKANPHLLKKERAFYKDDNGELSWADDHMPLHVVLTGGQERDAEEPHPDEAFAAFNDLHFPVLRNLNGVGRMVHTSKEELEQTSEQFAWKTPDRPFTYDKDKHGRTLEPGAAMPVPQPRSRRGRRP